MPRDFGCYDGKTTQSRAALMGKIGMFSTWQRPHYLITEEIEPARFGSALAWLMHVDGDTHRNAFLNSPWVKAILPIRPGRERERDAITSLQCQEIAGTESLNEPYPYDAKADTPRYKKHSMKKVLLMIEDKIASKYADSPKPVPLEDPKMKNPKLALAAETVFAHGFDLLKRGIRLSNGALGFQRVDRGFTYGSSCRDRVQLKGV